MDVPTDRPLVFVWIFPVVFSVHPQDVSLSFFAFPGQATHLLHAPHLGYIRNKALST